MITTKREVTDWRIAKSLTNETYGGDQLLSKREVAGLVGLCPKTIERMIQRGELSAHKLGSRIRIRRSDVEAWIERSRLEPSVHGI